MAHPHHLPSLKHLNTCMVPIRKRQRIKALSHLPSTYLDYPSRHLSLPASPGRQASLPPGELAKFEVAAPAEVPAVRTALQFAPWALDPVHLSAATMNEGRIE